MNMVGPSFGVVSSSETETLKSSEVTATTKASLASDMSSSKRGMERLKEDWPGSIVMDSVVASKSSNAVESIYNF